MIARATTDREIMARAFAVYMQHSPELTQLSPADDFEATFELSGLCRLHVSTRTPIPYLVGGRFALWLAQRFGLRAAVTTQTSGTRFVSDDPAMLALRERWREQFEGVIK